MINPQINQQQICILNSLNSFIVDRRKKKEVKRASRIQTNQMTRICLILYIIFFFWSFMTPLKMYFQSFIQQINKLHKINKTISDHQIFTSDNNIMRVTRCRSTQITVYQQCYTTNYPHVTLFIFCNFICFHSDNNVF